MAASMDDEKIEDVMMEDLKALVEIDLVGIGNPLLDISAPVSSAFLDKYKIKVGNAILAEELHMPMYDELSKSPDVDYTAGGATLNTIRIAQWAGNKAGRTGYIGCISDDKFGRMLQDSCNADGVTTNFMFTKEKETGTCGVCLNANDRSLVTKLEAANCYKDSHFEEKCQEMAYRAKIIYSSGFFATVSPPTMMKSAQITVKTGALYCINLAAPFIVEFFKEPFGKAMEFADFVFGNIDEGTTWAKVNGVGDTSPRGIAMAIATQPFAKHGRKRVCVITQGSKSSVLARSDGLFMEVPVNKLDQNKIVDVNSAGDAFVGGFLSALLEGKSYQQCLEFGHRCSRFIIQQSGCKLIGKNSSTLWNY